MGQVIEDNVEKKRSLEQNFCHNNVTKEYQIFDQNSILVENQVFDQMQNNGGQIVELISHIPNEHIDAIVTDKTDVLNLGKVADNDSIKLT